MLPILNATILYQLIALSVKLSCLLGVLWLNAIPTFSSHLYLFHLTGILLAYKSSRATLPFPALQVWLVCQGTFVKPEKISSLILATVLTRELQCSTMMPFPFARACEVSNSWMALRRLLHMYFLMIRSVQEKKTQQNCNWTVKLEFSKTSKIFWIWLW